MMITNFFRSNRLVPVCLESKKTRTLLPEEMKLAFSYLEATELSTCCCVSKQWSKLASDPILWNKLLPSLQIPYYNMNMHQYICKHGVKNQNQLCKRIRDLFRNTRVGKLFEFTCEFAFDPGCIIHSKFGSKDLQRKESDVKGHYIMLEKLKNKKMINIRFDYSGRYHYEPYEILSLIDQNFRAENTGDVILSLTTGHTYARNEIERLEKEAKMNQCEKKFNRVRIGILFAFIICGIDLYFNFLRKME